MDNVQETDPEGNDKEIVKWSDLLTPYHPKHDERAGHGAERL